MERNWETCVEFHGHACPVLAVGYRIGKDAISLLGLDNLDENQVVCLAESQVCSVDAISVMLGCTLGKGNMIVEDKGKQVYTIIRNDRDKGVRFALKPECHLPWGDPEVWPESTDGWEELQYKIINGPLEEVFDISYVENIHIDIPAV